MCAALSLQAHATTIVAPSTGVAITVARDGTYTISCATPAWTFSGIVTGGAINIRTRTGTDRAGDFLEIAFDEKSGPARHLAIRTWTGRPGVLFTETLSAPSPNPAPFPRFSTFPAIPHHLSFADRWFCAHFDLSGREGPWVFFDDAAQTAILSPATNFMVAKLGIGTAGEIESGIDTAIAALPKDYSHSTLLVVDRGINRTFDTWGRILTDFHGKVRPPNDADASLKYLGYWTDNGAAYYYNFDPSMGYEGTLLAVRDDLARAGLPIGYMQLDSWWYRKGPNGDWNPLPDQWNFGIHTYTAHPDLFPQGLASFASRVGVPLVTHARWIDANSPYRSQYRISNNVAVDPQYWTGVASYLKQSGVATYEQDWLDSRATANFNLTDEEAFMDDMAHALDAQGITMQYCMPTPRHVLQGAKYSNLTSIRLSDDHFERKYWPQVLYGSRLASSIGVWPWVDVFSSDEIGNLMMSTLSGGIVGGSDAIGTANVKNLSRAARPDGVLVKPDAPLVPTDSTYIAEAGGVAGPMVAWTYTDHGSNRAVYVVAINRGDAGGVAFTPAETGLSGHLFMYDVRLKTTALIEADRPMTIDLSQDWKHLVFVPVNRAGIAIVGDTGKFVSLGRARIGSIVDRGDAVDVAVILAAGETSVTLTGYSNGRPIVSGDAGDVTWNAETGLFTVPVSGTATIAAETPHHRRRAVR